MKVLILLLYYDRPLLLERCLASVRDSHASHPNWFLLFGDDNSPHPGEPIVRRVLAGHEARFACHRSSATVDEKAKSGLMLGDMANPLIRASPGDLVVTLCDDDELIPGYTAGLSQYFTERPGIDWAYSHVLPQNPLTGPRPAAGGPTPLCAYNRFTDPIDPCGRLDGSQVAFRKRLFDDGAVEFPSTTELVSHPNRPLAGNPDAYLFESAYRTSGPCPFTGLVGQRKGVHDLQMVWWKKSGSAGVRRYLEAVHAAAGATA